MAENLILLTGGAGFIGYHLSKKLFDETQDSIHIVDNLNHYYDLGLKLERLSLLGFQLPNEIPNEWIQSVKFPRLFFRKIDLSVAGDVHNILGQQEYKMVIHLAAQAGVRYSLHHPEAYVESNLLGFFNILELVKSIKPLHFLFASSSSVYGANKEIPFAEEQPILQPLNFYAASKASNELMAHAYSSLYRIPTTSLRFFTVYGPLGRPDMAYFKFAKAIYDGSTIDVFNFGNMKRDFTYVDDITHAIFLLMQKPPADQTPFETYNIGHHQPVQLGYFIELIESSIGKKANIRYVPGQPGEMQETYADVSKLKSRIDYVPATPVEVGVPKFVQWFHSFHHKEEN